MVMITISLSDEEFFLNTEKSIMFPQFTWIWILRNLSDIEFKQKNFFVFVYKIDIFPG